MCIYVYMVFGRRVIMSGELKKGVIFSAVVLLFLQLMHISFSVPMCFGVLCVFFFFILFLIWATLLCRSFGAPGAGFDLDSALFW